MTRFDELSKQEHLEIARKGGLTPKPRPQLLMEKCKRGHDMTEENTLWVNGHRKTVEGIRYPYRYKVCRACQKINRLKFKERHGLRRQAEAPTGYCRQGHKLDVMGESQTFEQKHTTLTGVKLVYKYKRCLACRREGHIRRQEAKGRTVTRRLKKYEA